MPSKAPRPGKGRRMQTKGWHTPKGSHSKWRYVDFFRENMLRSLPALGAEVTHDMVQSFIVKHPEIYRAIREHFSQAGFKTRRQRDSHEVMAVCAALLTSLPRPSPRSCSWQLKPDPRIFTLERTKGGSIRISNKIKEGSG